MEPPSFHVFLCWSKNLLFFLKKMMMIMVMIMMKYYLAFREIHLESEQDFRFLLKKQKKLRLFSIKTFFLDQSEQKAKRKNCLFFSDNLCFS